MKIIQINTFYPRGGAAKVAGLIKSSLDEKKITNYLVVKQKSQFSGNIISVEPHFFYKVLNKIFDTDIFGNINFTFLNKILSLSSDSVIHFHNLHGGYFNILSILKISRTNKTVWTLHDPWIIYNRKKLAPQYNNIFKKNKFFRKILKLIIKKSNIILVVPSNWLKKLVEIDYPEKQIELINNGIDTAIFKPTNKIVAKQKLNIDISRKVIIFVANGGERNFNKGFRYLDYIKKNISEKLEIICLGEGENYIDNPSRLSLYYSAADLLLFPSLADNFPLVVLESMSCGTPVVSFNTGGIQEIISHKKDGYCARYGNKEDLLNGVNFILNNGNYNSLSISARKKITENFSKEIMIEKYINLYKRIK